MQALGMIETLGLLPAIECADVMLKTAQVKVVGRMFVGGGLVTIAVTGDVGAVKAAVEAGVSAVKKISHMSLVSQHVIPRPSQEIDEIVASSHPGYDSKNKGNPWSSQDAATEPAEIVSPPETTAPTTMKNANTKTIKIENLHKAEVDALVQTFGLEKGIEALNALSVVKLRHLAREYKEFGLAGRAVSKANKELLIQQFKSYYEREI